MINSIRHRHRFGSLLLLLAVPAACGDAGGDDEAARTAYLTRLGEDTLAVEWVEFGEGWVEASALMRGPRTTWGEYRLETDADGRVTGWEARTWAGGGPNRELLRTEYVTTTEAGPVLVTIDNTTLETRTRPFEGPAGAVPWVDPLHWSFDLAFRRAAEEDRLGDPVSTFPGVTFEVEGNEDGSWALIHPSRGTFTVELSPEGHLLSLDGTGSTSAYLLDRMEFDALDPEALGAHFADRPLGPLSGRGEIATTVAGVRFTGDFGTPSRRGREIFGTLVAYGERWRTGANRATHLAFDRDLVIDGVTIPAGEYTLYSIPEADGGTLMINRETGQFGTNYNASMEEARVEMRRDTLDESVEVFEVRVVEDDSGEGDGRIELRWAETVYYVPFTVG
ncbi:MAG: DUF2911 domain-containing protein [Longimicrobiales bacterium]|nr:DUF2911 domain-containing protein [Longimicrobiales bacterium]